ncbi:hypothetical protein ES707_21547 [subsurface metagenome]
MKKILFLIEFLLFERRMPGIRLKEIMKYLIRFNYKVFSYSFLNEYFFRDGFYRKSLKNFNFFVCVGRDYTNKNFLLKFFYKFIITLRSVRYIKKIVVTNDIEKLWISTPKIYPLFFIYVARIFRAIRRLEVILEYRDVWSLNEQLNFPKLKKCLLFNIEKFLIKRVDKFIFATELIKKTYMDYFGYTNKNIYDGLVLYTGFNPNYYKDKIIKNGRLTFTYTGSFYHSRNPLFFLRTIFDFIEVNNYCDDIMIYLILNYCQSDIYNCVIEERTKRNFNKIVKILNNITRRKVINYLSRSDILVIITHSTKGSYDTLPGKMAEYVGAKKNILAISNDPLVIEAIRNDKLGWVCSHNDKKALFNILTEIYEKWNRKSLVFKGNYTKYSVDERYKQLDNFLFSQ